ncbi:hypothetical protein [Collimonas antrihumi]|nr:hypothetical protein [Collimonas antrihumi]
MKTPDVPQAHPGFVFLCDHEPSIRSVAAPIYAASHVVNLAPTNNEF